MLAVSCKNIKKTYGSGPNAVTALRGINLDIETGELVMIVGPSGSGKTTLLSVIAGILSPDNDDYTCTIFGEPIHSLPDNKKTLFRGQNIGFVFQTFNLVPMLTSAENVAVPLLLNGHEPKEAEKKAANLLAEFGIPEKANISPLELSGGQQQRVAIARSIIHEPKLIVCDEPTAYLDHETGQKVMTLLKEKALNKDRALIVVTHDERIFPFATRIIHIEDGLIK